MAVVAAAVVVGTMVAAAVVAGAVVATQIAAAAWMCRLSVLVVRCRMIQRVMELDTWAQHHNLCHSWAQMVMTCSDLA